MGHRGSDNGRGISLPVVRTRKEAAYGCTAASVIAGSAAAPESPTDNDDSDG